MGLVKIVFWKHQPKKNGEIPIYLRITEDRKTRYIRTPFAAREEDWDEGRNLFRTRYRRAEDQHKVAIHQYNNELLQKRIADAEKLIKEMEEEKTLASSEQVKQEILRQRDLGKSSVLAFIENIISNKTQLERIGTANCYKNLKRSLSQYLKKQNREDITFKEINAAFLKRYEMDFRLRKSKDTGISFYMRSLRAVFNAAIEARVCSRESYPFNEYRISHLKTTTIKRAITKEEISKIRDLQLPKDSPLFHSRLYFLFSYYNRGINFSDMSVLTWKHIKEDRLTYTRMKTHKNYTIKLLAPAIEIIKYYKENLFLGDDAYVFPILNMEKHTTEVAIKNRIHKVLGQTNKDLKEIGEKIGLDIPLTTYVARHTFATVMKRSGVSTSIISEALGHDSERTTQIYLDSFANDVLDDASMALL